MEAGSVASLELFGLYNPFGKLSLVIELSAALLYKSTGRRAKSNNLGLFSLFEAIECNRSQPADFVNEGMLHVHATAASLKGPRWLAFSRAYGIYGTYKIRAYKTHLIKSQVMRPVVVVSSLGVRFGCSCEQVNTRSDCSTVHVSAWAARGRFGPCWSCLSLRKAFLTPQLIHKP